jgi:transcriptional regulator with XRE-family HTH domain
VRRRIVVAEPDAVFTRLLGFNGMEVAVIDAVKSKLGERIRQAREEAGLSVIELSTLTGMPGATIEAIEAGEPLSTSALNRIAAATGRRVDFFLQPDDDVFDVLLRAGEGTTVGIRAAVDMLAKFTADYEFLISLEE